MVIQDHIAVELRFIWNPLQREFVQDLLNDYQYYAGNAVNLEDFQNVRSRISTNALFYYICSAYYRENKTPPIDKDAGFQPYDMNWYQQHIDRYLQERYTAYKKMFREDVERVLDYYHLSYINRNSEHVNLPVKDVW